MTQYRIKTRHGWLPLVCVALGACSSSAPTKELDRIDSKEIAEAAGCSRDEIAVCIEIDCQPDEYRCAPKDDVLELFKAREFQHR